MKVVEIRNESEFDQLRPAWDALLTESPSSSIFLTWEWLASWWSAYGSPGDLRILTAWNGRGDLRGIAPLRSGTLRNYAQTVPGLSFIGDAPVNCDSDYMDFVSAAGSESEVLTAFGDYLMERMRGGLVLRLNEIPETSPNLTALKEFAGSHTMTWQEHDVDCATVRLPQTWEEYLSRLKPRFRTKVRSVLRNLENRSEVKFRFCENVDDLNRLLPVLYDLHARRWQQESKPGVFGDGSKREFYRTLSQRLLERGWLRFSFLEWKDRILACQYGFAYRGVYSQLQEGYEPASEHWNSGVGLRAWSIRELMTEGLREYDFLGGVSRHKLDWGAEVKRSKRLVTAVRSHRNLFFVEGPRWEAGAKESLRRILPERVLAARRAWRNRHHGACGKEWLRPLAARCYVHSGAPALMRALWNRYRISINSQGEPRLSLGKREGSSARIFCYHRVNDDQDPFFPATPVKAFDAQMRYLSRHYKVVSMAELYRHLESGKSVETVVGVTFDDGYRDNYEYAFPILRRYGLPATIFLTTGSVDSGDPMWFDRLAAAIKASTCESLDLEIDIPRRFLLRTPEERLSAFGQLATVFRTLPDTERRLWLAELLKQLGHVDREEHKGKMLTWDQIRLMNAEGIEFGGHTVTHPCLSRLTAAEASWEVTECKRRVEEELQTPARFFAYPNGRPADFAPTHKQLLRDAGYQAAVTTIWGTNYSSTDRMELRRGAPWEDNPALFALKLDWYQWVS